MDVVGCTSSSGPRSRAECARKECPGQSLYGWGGVVLYGVLKGLFVISRRCLVEDSAPRLDSGAAGQELLCGRVR